MRSDLLCNLFFSSKDNKLRYLIAFFGLSISLLSLLNESLINRDGVLYLQAAQVYDESGFLASFKIYRWPFFSILIAIFQSITRLSFENSAHLLYVILLFILVDAFVRFYWELNSKISYRWMPAVIILAYTGLNDYRPMIVRDWGYWAFLLQALLYFVKAYKYNAIKYHTLWQVFIVIAFLFRVEAVVFIVLLPFLFLIKKKSIVSFLYSQYFLYLSVVIVLYFGISENQLGRVREIFSYMDIYSYLSRFVEYSHTVAKHALRHHAESNAILFSTSGLLGVAIVKSIAKLGAFYIVILIIGKFKSTVLKSFQHSFIDLFLCISCVIFFIYFFDKRVIAGRYTIQITLFLLFYVTYYAEFILDKIKSSGQKWLLGVFGCAFLINFFIGIHHSGSNKIYIKEMGGWVNNNIISSARITTNDPRLYYYSGGILNKNISKYRESDLNKNISKYFNFRNYDYALLKIKEGDTRYDKLIKKGELKNIYSKVSSSGDAAVLFKINNS